MRSEVTPLNLFCISIYLKFLAKAIFTNVFSQVPKPKGHINIVEARGFPNLQ